MAELLFTDGFIEDMTQVMLETKRAEIKKFVSLLGDYPELGSANVPASIRRQYGDKTRKLVVDPFDVIYEWDKYLDKVNVLGLVHQRAIP